MLVGFVIPFKPKCQSSDWAHDCRLLNRTIHSLLNQTNKEFKIYVVYSNPPQEVIVDKKLKYIEYFESFQKIADIPNAEYYLNRFGSSNMVEARYDKGRKIMYGCKIGIEEECQYLMNVDADDLVSNKLVSYLKKQINSGSPDGWYIPSGYVWRENDFIILRENNMQDFNGSTHIIHKDAIKIPNFSSPDWSDYNLFVAHGWTLNRLKEYLGKTLKPIPFRAVIYMVHKNNLSGLNNKHHLFTIKGLLKVFFRGQLITSKMKSEFSIN